MNNANIFVSYSHKDKKWKNHVITFLDVICRASGFKYQTWHDDEIGLGKKWKSEIDNAMTSAQVAVLLISPDFLTSKFILENEVPQLMEYDKEGSLLMIPLIVRPCPWELFDWLSPIQGYLDDSVILSGCNEHELESLLTKFSREVNRIIIDRASASEAEKESSAPSEEDGAMAPSTPEAPDKLIEQSELSASLKSVPYKESRVLKDSRGFLTDAGVTDLVEKSPKNASQEGVVDLLKVFQTRKQRTWFAVTGSKLFCVLDDEKTALSGRKVQWGLPLTEAYPIIAKTRPAKATGLISIGPRQNWIYSQKLHPNAANLKTKIEELIEKGRHS
jgi:hypothetical protein